MVKLMVNVLLIQQIVSILALIITIGMAVWSLYLQYRETIRQNNRMIELLEGIEKNTKKGGTDATTLTTRQA